MSQILDEGLMRSVKTDQRCRRIRFFTLLFTGLVACGYLLLDIIGHTIGKWLLVLGLVSISFQTVMCYLYSPKKHWLSALRVILTVLTTLFILYMLITNSSLLL